jgi:hypothetical protein
MSTMEFRDNEGYTEMNAGERNLEEHMDRAEEHASTYANGGTDPVDGHELDAGERLQHLGEATHEAAAGLKGYGNGASEVLEHEFEGDGTVTGELTEAGVAIGGEVLEMAAEAGMEVVSATVDAAGSVYEGVGEGIHHGVQAWDAATSGDLNSAAEHLGEGAKALGEGIVDAVGLEVQGAVGMGVEVVEGLLSVGWEIGEGIDEVGTAIADSEVFHDVTDVVGDVGSGIADGASAVADGVGDAASAVADGIGGAWDSLFGDDDSSGDSDTEETPEAEPEEEQSEDDSWF